MNELTNLIFTEKYRPQRFEDLILQDKQRLLNYLLEPKAIPSFLFISKTPGTGKTSTAKLVARYLKCDTLKLNASDERGIDTIREKIKVFVRGLSSDIKIKRMVFLDEADGLTGIAQNSLRNMIEEYSKNAFFVLTCNNISKVIEAIRSRCVEFYFDKPNKKEILDYLKCICVKEEIKYEIGSSLSELVNLYYPNIRNMVKILQDTKINDKPLEIFLDEVVNFDELWDDIRRKQITIIKDKIFKAEIDPIAFNDWLFKELFNNWEKYKWSVVNKVIPILADNERCFTMNMNQDIIFLANVLKIMEIL